MRWLGRQGSDNVEDQRGSGGTLLIGGGVGGVIIYILSLLFGGGDPNQGASSNALQDSTSSSTATSPEDTEAKFVSVVLKDTEDIWTTLFKNQGATYQDPKLVLFTNSIQSACGFASSASGPFYCPADSKVYIDLSFYNELQNRFGASGDFAMAYVVAHEVGHHVQHLLGITAKADSRRQSMDEAAKNALSVSIELQADFFAGVWAHYEQSLKNVVDPGDIDEALNAANAIGDDRLQQMSQGYIVPDAFTHGTSKQRMYWFKKGYDTGDMNQGDTFKEQAN